MDETKVATEMVDPEWRSRVAQLVLVKQAIAEADFKALWPHHLPSLAATETALLEVEASLGEPLQPSHRACLATAGGWRGFLQTIDLFGPEDFLGGSRWTHGQEKLSYVEDDVLASIGIRRDDVFPIAASSVDLDLFVMCRRSSTIPGVVIWLAGGEIERFGSFDEFFLAALDYNRREVVRVRER